MKEKERLLFKTLCNFQSDTLDETLLEYATPTVLGYLFLNRMQGIAYGTLKKHNLLGKVNREFRNSLREAYEQNIKKNQDFCECITYLNQILSRSSHPYAMLKGALLCSYYPEGFRTSNDIDLLVLPEHVTDIGSLLTSAGFRQGHLQNGEFTPANRREIIESKMMRGETVPYIKQMNLPEMKYLEVDINFSLDYKNGETDILEKMLSESRDRKTNAVCVQTLDYKDFFIHLCCHLYKEATTLPWVEMKRDMTLYKYCDIYILLSSMSDREIGAIYKRAKELNMEQVVAFTIIQTAAIFDIHSQFAISMSENILCSDKQFLHIIHSPAQKEMYIYEEKDIEERFFSNNRKALLKEVKNHEKTGNETK